MIKRRIKWGIFLIVVSISAIAFKKPAEKYFEIAKSLDIFATLFKEVNTYYVDEVDPKKLITHGINGMLESLDPYTDFIPEEQIESFRISTTGQYAGIGALIGVVNDKTVFTHPYKDFPAYKSGIKVGDEIIAVDGKDVRGKSTAQISSLLKGQAKTDVQISVKRYGTKDPITLKIKREKISISNLAYAGIIANDIAYIKLDDFTPGAAKEVAAAITELKSQGAKKVILDLRDNPGGLLLEAVNIVNLFVPKGVEVVSTKGKVNEWNKTYNTLNNPLDTEIPIAILTGEGSASASEIVAGSLQDYDRAVLIGNKTFGKGLVQTTRPLSYNAQLKVTTAKYYIPSGRCIQALDYSNRSEDGSVQKTADSLKREFKTKGGRIVYDGAGLDPDVEINNDYLGTITTALITQGLLFEFASKYCAENPTLPNLQTFKLSDNDFERFVAFTRAQNFRYNTQLETHTKQLIETARQEKYYPELESQLNALKTKIESNKASDFTRFKSEITELLTQQIAFHYALSEGQAIVSFTQDKTIQQAIQTLNDSVKYKKILTPQ